MLKILLKRICLKKNIVEFVKFLMNNNHILGYIEVITRLRVVGLLEEMWFRVGIIFLLILIIGIRIKFSKKIKKLLDKRLNKIYSIDIEQEFI